jgi:hypothetical protein
MVRLATAEDDLRAAVAEHVDAWTPGRRAWQRRGRAGGCRVDAALEKLAEAEEQRRAIRVSAAWLAQVQENGSLDGRVRPVTDETSLADARSANARLRADEILAALAANIDASSAAAYEVGAAESAEERRRVERLGRLRAHENPNVQAAATMVDSGELTLAEAESVAAAGVALDDVLEQARPAPGCRASSDCGVLELGAEAELSAERARRAADGAHATAPNVCQVGQRR